MKITFEAEGAKEAALFQLLFLELDKATDLNDALNQAKANNVRVQREAAAMEEDYRGWEAGRMKRRAELEEKKIKLEREITVLKGFVIALKSDKKALESMTAALPNAGEAASRWSIFLRTDEHQVVIETVRAASGEAAVSTYCQKHLLDTADYCAKQVP